MVRVGDFELLPLLDGYFRLDGGAMFGVVPKALWEKRAPADERNRITMAMRPLLVRRERLMLIDAGCGDKMDAKSADIYGFDRRENLDVTMARAGIGTRGTIARCQSGFAGNDTAAVSPWSTIVRSAAICFHSARSRNWRSMSA